MTQPMRKTTYLIFMALLDGFLQTKSDFMTFHFIPWKLLKVKRQTLEKKINLLMKILLYSEAEIPDLQKGFMHALDSYFIGSNGITIQSNFLFSLTKNCTSMSDVDLSWLKQTKFEVLTNIENHPTYTFSISEFKQMLGVNEKKYNAWSNFQLKVLKPLVSEYNLYNFSKRVSYFLEKKAGANQYESITFKFSLR